MKDEELETIRRVIQAKDEELETIRRIVQAKDEKLKKCQRAIHQMYVVYFYIVFITLPILLLCIFVFQCILFTMPP